MLSLNFCNVARVWVWSKGAVVMHDLNKLIRFIIDAVHASNVCIVYCCFPFLLIKAALNSVLYKALYSLNKVDLT